MTSRIRKAIIPIAGLGTRFLPLSKTLPKEMWPLVDKPVIQYIVEEARDAGIKEIIFVGNPKRRMTVDYFEKKLETKKTSLSKYKSHFLADIQNLKNISENITFRQAFQKSPLGASHAVLQAAEFVKNEPCAILWADDVVESNTPCIGQLIKAFEKCKKPVVALYGIPKESFKYYGMADVKKMSPRLFKINRFAEKPEIKDAPSNLAVVGKYILTPEVFARLKKTHFSLKADISLTDTLSEMAMEGKEIYGYEFEGKWLECGNKLAYLKTNLYLSLKHPQYKKELEKFLRKR